MGRFNLLTPAFMTGKVKKNNPGFSPEIVFEFENKKDIQ
jgi:hypothetical protein